MKSYEGFNQYLAFQLSLLFRFVETRTRATPWRLKLATLLGDNETWPIRGERTGATP
ncbi:MAG: hypothetical protein ABIP35_06600 [Ginsengibacter sp.]